MKRQRLVVLLSLFLIQSSVLIAADRPLRFAVPAPATTYLPLWAAKEAKFFDKHNLAVELVYVGSSPIALAALLADEIDIQAGTDVAIASYLQGYRDLALFGALSNVFPFKIHARPSITDVSRLRGKRLGISRIGGTLDFAVRFFLKKSGLDPKDVLFIQVGSVPNIVSALKAGSIDAAGVPIPLDSVLMKAGFPEIADLTTSGARYATTSFLAKRHNLTRNRSRMEGFIKALIESIRFVKTQRGEAMKILSQYTGIKDLELLRAGYEQYLSLWPRVPEIKPDDIKLGLEHAAERNPKAREIDPSVLIYSQLVEDIVKSGFVDQTYR